uniref:Aquaporin-9 n=1 Tax=Strongyloides papillosus TaxID=174720 RepID=A0A0N5BZ55_STREA
MTLIKNNTEVARDKARVKNETLKVFLSEFFGTFLLCFIGLAINAQFILHKGTLNQWINVNFGWAFAIVFSVMATAKTSGAHLNPAITFMFYTYGNIGLIKMLIYIVAQLLGGFLGAAGVYGFYYEAINHFDHGVRAVTGATATAGIFASYPAPYCSFFGSFVDQIVGTGLLALFVSAIIDQRNEVPSHLHAPLFGGVLVMIGCSFGMNLGYPINPARDLGPRIFTLFPYGTGVFSSPSTYYWIAPTFAPFIGAAIGGWLYHVFIGFHLSDPVKKEYIPISAEA